jgi:S-adenosylmethionine decarboxylase
MSYVTINIKIQYHTIYIKVKMSSQLVGSVSTGKHMICDLTNVRNMTYLESMDKMHELLEDICTKYDFSILAKAQHQFEPQGLTILYMLSESHISIHTFPEKRYLALDIYTCREYEDDSVYLEIYDKLVKWFQCDYDIPTILSRGLPAKTNNMELRLYS